MRKTYINIKNDIFGLCHNDANANEEPAENHAIKIQHDSDPN